MKIYTSFRFCLALLLFLFLTLTQNAVSQTHAADFNADGYSDLTLVTIDSDKSLRWDSFNTTNGIVAPLGTFGISGNHLTIARWMSSAAPSIGSLALDGSNSIVWKVQHNGTVIAKKFGKRNHLAISGADFDGNGVDDAAVAYMSNKKVAWAVSYNLFAQSNPKRKTILFGTTLSKIFYARPQKGRDWLGIVTRDSKKHPVVQFKDTRTAKTVTVKGIPSFALAANALRPVPVRQTNGTDLLCFNRVVSKQTRIYCYRMSGRKVATTVIPMQGDIVVGNFTDSPGYEIAVKNAAQKELFVFNPVNKQSTVISAQKGIAVDSININSITANAVPAPQPTPRTPTGGNPSIPVGDTVTCSTIIDINTLRNVLYKNENIHGGRGRTWLDQGHRMKGVRRIYVAGLNGVIFGCFGLYACDNPYGCRYYQKMCGDPLSNSQFTNAAVRNGDSSSTAYVTSGNGTCYKFTARKARDGNIIK